MGWLQASETCLIKSNGDWEAVLCVHPRLYFNDFKARSILFPMGVLEDVEWTRSDFCIPQKNLLLPFERCSSNLLMYTTHVLDSE